MGRSKKKKKNGGSGESSSNEETAVEGLLTLVAGGGAEEPSKEEAGHIFGEALNMINGKEEVMVDLKNTRIGDKRAKSIVKALEQGAPNLTFLDLSHNTISDVQAESLAAVLADGKAPKLSVLNLSANSISVECRERVMTKLKGRKDLVLELNLAEKVLGN